MDNGDKSNSPISPSSTNDLRKSNKPMMERRRRARINFCLTQLKSLVLEATKKDAARYSKLEKADILEMTVKHLRNVQRHHVTAAMSHDYSVIGKYKSGFHECTREVTRYLNSITNVSDDVKTRMMSHLSNYVSGIENAAGPKQATHVAGPYIQVQPVRMQTQQHFNEQQFVQQPQYIQQNQYVQQQYLQPQPQQFYQQAQTQYVSTVNNAVQIIPGTLSNGQVAYFVPNVSNCANVIATSVASVNQQQQIAYQQNHHHQQQQQPQQQIPVKAVQNSPVVYTNQMLTPTKASEAPVVQASPVLKGSYQATASVKASEVPAVQLSPVLKGSYQETPSVNASEAAVVQLSPVLKGSNQVIPSVKAASAGGPSSACKGSPKSENNFGVLSEKNVPGAANIMKKSSMQSNYPPVDEQENAFLGTSALCNNLNLNYSFDDMDGNFGNGNNYYQENKFSVQRNFSEQEQENMPPVEAVWRPW